MSPCFTARRRITGFWRHILKTERGWLSPAPARHDFRQGMSKPRPRANGPLTSERDLV